MLCCDVHWLFTVAGPVQLSKMDTQTMYVPVTFLLKIQKIKDLTESEEAVMKAVHASPKLLVDDHNNRVRPNHTVKRNTIILREVPEGSKEADVRAIFDGIAGTVEHCENEFGNIWFVRMSDEGEAKDAVFKLQLKGQKARLKSENILRSYIGKAAPVRMAQSHIGAVHFFHRSGSSFPSVPRF